VSGCTHQPAGVHVQFANRDTFHVSNVSHPLNFRNKD
jgi:hypothetical protein